MDVMIPLHSFGRISHIECTPPAGSISVQPDQSSLVWAIGQKFPTKNLQLALPATVTFKPDTKPVSSIASVIDSLSTLASNHW